MSTALHAGAPREGQLKGWHVLLIMLAFFGVMFTVNGFFLYSAYEVQCYTERWFAYMPWVALAAFVFSIGIPAGFLFLILKFKDRGKAGDRSVRKAIGWLYEPFRSGKEWWVAAEPVNLHFADHNTFFFTAISVCPESLMPSTIPF